MADVIATGRFNRLMLIDAHTAAIEGFFGVPMDHLTAVPALAQAMQPLVKPDAVIVAPDLGAVKLARAYARILQLPIAFVQKTRLDGDKVETQGVVGDVKGRTAWIVDDMASTGGTIAAAMEDHIPAVVRYLMRGLGSDAAITELASYLLFDAEFCGRLIELGRRDVETARESIESFFAPSAPRRACGGAKSAAL